MPTWGPARRIGALLFVLGAIGNVGVYDKSALIFTSTQQDKIAMYTNFFLPTVGELANGTRASQLNSSITEATTPPKSKHSSVPLNTTQTTQYPRYNETLALMEPYIRGGFRNQAMRFTAFVFHARKKGIHQLLLPSINWCDKYGSDGPVPFDQLFDVDHWNSFHPSLPLLVPYDPSQHFEWDKGKFSVENPRENAKHPYAHGHDGKGAGPLWWEYKSYAHKRRTNPHIPRDPTEIFIFKALRPCRRLRELIAGQSDAIREGNYMALHARVEPDMLAHNDACPHIKVHNLTDIFTMFRKTFPEPPASDLFIAINRKNLDRREKKGREHVQAQSARNVVALNDAESNGLWDGKVSAFEVGLKVLDDPFYDDKREISASVMNFFLAVNARVFVGTEVSTYSTDVWTVRYHWGKHENYKYLPWPEGVVPAAPNGTDPLPYDCHSENKKRRAEGKKILQQKGK